MKQVFGLQSPGYGRMLALSLVVGSRWCFFCKDLVFQGKVGVCGDAKFSAKKFECAVVSIIVPSQHAQGGERGRWWVSMTVYRRR